MVGIGGIIGLITGGSLGGAIDLANTANNKANLANDKVDNLITTTTQDKANTSNYILNTSNVIMERIDNLNSSLSPTVANIFPLLYNNHFEQISDGLNPNQISVKNINSAGRFDYEFLKIPPTSGFLNYSVNGWLLLPSGFTDIFSNGFFAGSRVDKIFISNAGFTPHH